MPTQYAEYRRSPAVQVAPGCTQVLATRRKRTPGLLTAYPAQFTLLARCAALSASTGATHARRAASVVRRVVVRRIMVRSAAPALGIWVRASCDACRPKETERAASVPRPLDQRRRRRRPLPAAHRPLTTAPHVAASR